ncbi:dGTPase [Geosporobacter subterraneus DSM 17957]|uniref:Deoxyguanosinetriphosphate triphosphohydrolase-like protein n=1 Tax=Geosporobacter subterraneus DSM 17957 TaxID=1121919 RepID=A0A1M6JKA4_9FIRM|nr:deoxyguanosinetriphosphate triphosphohydrolase [Geosporobacter subterraneus]SHJ47140.1 dGTPase [Geosporobacter subterraneus DSM 17957]
MLFREITEKYEKERFSPYATLSENTRGRMFHEPPCEVRTEFQRDRDRILHAKAFRRLKHKTQVFLSPEGDHYRTRLTHTLEVAQISRTVARALQLNEDLTEAIALGHDLGHTPFGHSGERVLNEVHPTGFHHNVQSLRVVDHLEKGKRGYGLNLTFEVRNGILHHTGSESPATLEAQIVKISDRIAYINHDIDDAIRAGVLKYEDLPKDCLENLGFTHSDRINAMIMDVIYQSQHQTMITQSQEKLFYIDKLRSFMFDNVYLNKKAKREEEKAQHIIQELYHYFLRKYDKLPDEMRQRIQEFGVQETVKDYIAGMTDRYAIQKYLDIFVPTVWK